MKDKKEYIAPELTVVTFKTERGYAASADGAVKSAFIGLLSLSGESSYNTFGNENWTNDDALNSGW